jgi:hypothetical protein
MAQVVSVICCGHTPGFYALSYRSLVGNAFAASTFPAAVSRAA